MFQHRPWINYQVSADDSTEESDDTLLPDIESTDHHTDQHSNYSDDQGNNSDNESISDNYSSDEDDEDEDEDIVNGPATYTDLLETLSMKWLSIHLLHNVSLTATYAFWKLALSTMPLLMQLKRVEDVTRKTPQFVQLRKKLYANYCPNIHLDFHYQKSNEEPIVIKSASKNPVKEIERNPEYKKQCESAHIKVTLTLLITTFPRSFS